MSSTISARGLISVFGSSKPRPGSAAYEQAREVGKLLADAGFAVATGGYSGTMAAVSQGAASEGGHVVGVGCKRIELFRPGGLNEWVVEAVQYETLQDRLLHLVTHNDGMIVLPGGIGTLSELALAWSLLQVKEIEPRPLVLLGEIWRDTMQTFIRSEYVPEPHATLLHYADTPQDAVGVIQRALEN
ncbi:MAG TPA: LOG family protein [Candidatus Sulfomarinibacteraceae bacterium]|nr:LOG family protein [Candidatus Sulfomarinibacteraceae bacterium]